jgi:radical SAM protein with 4Fe4S-binding SPASM domain
MMTAEKTEALLRVEAGLREHPFPPQLVVETTAYCNFRCRHCHHDELRRKKGIMKRELWSKIVGEVAERAPDCEVWPTFYGEALMMRDRLFRRVREARELGLKNLVLNSNGSFCRGPFIDEILTCGLRRFLLSLDGFTAETFERIRYTRDPNGTHERVYAGVRQLLERKRELDDRGIETPKIICQFSKMDENEHEAEPFAAYWLSQGADVKIREKVTWTGFVEAGNLTRDYGQRIACPWGHNTCAIHWNGDVVACAVDSEGQFTAGNINDTSLEAIWNTTLRSFRAAHREHRWDDLPVLCRACVDWQAVGAAHYTPDGRVYHSVAAVS